MHDPAASAATPRDARAWAQILARYRQPSTGRSIVEIVITVVPLATLWVLAWATLDIGYWLALPLAMAAAGFLVRLFAIQHDCSHGAFFRHRLANDWFGRVAGVLTFTPYGVWRQAHATHHASTGNLDRRGLGDVATLTVQEYRACSFWGRLRYRLYRHPLVMFGLGPAYLFILQYRLPIGLMRGRRAWVSSMTTNLAIASIVALLIWLIGLKAFLLVHLPSLLLAASVGVWMFYVQHQFDRTTWANAGSGTCTTQPCTAARTTTCRRSCAGSPPISACTTCITSTAAFPTTACRVYFAIIRNCARSAG